MAQRFSASERIVLGEVSGAHGLAGELRVRIAGDGPEHLLAAEVVWLGRSARDPEARRRAVVSAALAPRGEVRLQLEGIASRRAVEPLIGQVVLASEAMLEPLPEGEFYWYQLVGCDVYDAQGRSQGRVKEIWETGAHDVLLVEDEEGRRRLVPTAASLLETIDLEARRIVVADLPGLLEPI